MTDTRNTQSAPPGRSLRRSKEQRILAGVAGGLGEHLGINAWWFRWAFILLAFAGGAGVLLYIVAWIFVPEPGEDETAVSQWLSNLDLSDTGTVIGVVLIGAATLIVATSVFDISGTMVTAAVLFAVGLLLYRGGLLPPPNPPKDGSDGSESSGDATVETGDAPTGDSQEEPAIAPSTTSVDGAPVAAAVAAAPAAPTPVVRQPKQRSMLGRLTLAIGLIVVAGMALLDVSGITVGSIGPGEWFDPVHYAIAAMFIVGGGLLIGSLFGKAHWLIVIGFLLIPVLFVTSLWPSSFDWSFGDVTHRPEAVVDVGDGYRLGAGSMTVDLTRLTAQDLSTLGTLDLSVGLGELVVRVPDDVGVLLTADIGAGEIRSPLGSDDGVGIDVQGEFGPQQPSVSIDIEMGAGSVEVRQFERTTP